MEYTFRPIDSWPRPKTKRSIQSRFRVRYSDTLELLDKELRFIVVRKIVIQIDLPESQIRNDGLPYAKARPVFQGVILSFESKHGPLRYLTDTFDDWQENLRAITLGLEALRKVDRYGITRRGEQYKGWKQLPAGAGPITDVHDAAGFVAEHAAAFVAKHSEFTPLQILTDGEICKKAYRQAAKKLHPDHDGNQEEFALLQEAKRLLIS